MVDSKTNQSSAIAGSLESTIALAKKKAAAEKFEDDEPNFLLL